MLETSVIRNIFKLVAWENVEVKQFKPRSAMIGHTLLSIERNEYLERLLAQKANANVQNHSLYMVSLPDESSFVIFCQDLEMHVGIGVTVGNW